MEYLEALRYSRCAKDVYELRRRVHVVRTARERETIKIDSVSPGRSRPDRRLRRAMMEVELVNDGPVTLVIDD